MSALLHRIRPEDLPKLYELCKAVFINPLKTSQPFYYEDETTHIPVISLGTLGLFPLYETLIYHVSDKLLHYFILHRVPSEKEKAEYISKMFADVEINRSNRMSIFAYQYNMYKFYKSNFKDTTPLSDVSL